MDLSEKIFNWYDEVSNSKEFTQGDIINDCFIPQVNEEVYNSILNEEEYTSTLDIKKADLIVLSQACDIKNEKINFIILSSIWPLSNLMKSNDYYNSEKGKENLRQGKEPAYHLLNEYKSVNINMPFTIVDFHRIYSLPKEFIKSFIKDISYRLRLLPPYREHLSQAFARYFMRVGLPIDISKEEIKNYKV